MTGLEEIINWDMTPREAKTYKVCLLWQKIAKEILPGKKMSRIPLKGDPRKCYLFRCCWKLVRETTGLLKGEEYPLYLRAGLTMLKDHYNDPMGLCGDKAWIRWKIWKRAYEKRLKTADTTITEETKIDREIFIELDRTKRFLYAEFDGEPDKVKFDEKVESGSMRLWLLLDQISPFYLILSAWIPEPQTLVKYDLEIFEQKITDNVREYFAKEYSLEG